VCLVRAEAPKPAAQSKDDGRFPRRLLVLASRFGLAGQRVQEKGALEKRPKNEMRTGEAPGSQMELGFDWSSAARDRYSNSVTGSRSSRTYIGRPLPLGKVVAASMPTAW
jgi:hypothetical protein